MKTLHKIVLTVFGWSLIWISLADAGEARKRISSTANDYSNLSDIEAEIRFGRDLSARILGNYKLLKDEKKNKYIGLIGTGLAQYAGRPELKFYFGILETDEINAFAAPGGYVFITKGALAQMENEAQLAAVLGHEIAHVVKRHVVRKLNIKGDQGSATGGFASMIGGATGSFREAFEHSLLEAEEILFKKGYGIEEEIEADQFGILLASAAGYAPEALRDFLVKCKRFESGNPKTDSEHPPHEIRIQKMNETLQAEGLLNGSNAKMRNRFNDYIHK
jgi:beta-barrel assembly-enhancing protease